MATPVLAPLFRSDTQFRILGELAVNLEREWTIRELARTLDAPYATVWSELDRLRQLGVVATRQAGRSLQVRFAAEGSFVRPLQQLLLQSYGPLPLLRDRLADVAGVHGAWIYGSWARRYAGELGRRPADVDLLVVVAAGADPLPVYRAAGSVGEITGVVVDATVLTDEQWEGDTSSFTSSVRAGPRVVVLGDDYGDVVA